MTPFVSIYNYMDYQSASDKMANYKHTLHLGFDSGCYIEPGIEVLARISDWTKTLYIDNHFQVTNLNVNLINNE